MKYWLRSIRGCSGKSVFACREDFPIALHGNQRPDFWERFKEISIFPDVATISCARPRSRTLIPVDQDRVLVRLDADFSESRGSRVRVSGGALVAGILGSGVIAVLGSLLAAPEAFMVIGGAAAVPTLAGAAAGYQIGKGHRDVIMKAQLALEQTLDRLEFGNARRIK